MRSRFDLYEVLKLRRSSLAFLMIVVMATSLYSYASHGDREAFLEDSSKQAKDAAQVVDHAICKEVENGRTVGKTRKFLSDDHVFCWVKITDNVDWDKVEWLFKGPNGIERSIPYREEWSGEDYCYAMLDLSEYEAREVVGDWKVTLYMNGREVFTEEFTVEPLGGLVWWGPMVGLLLILIAAVAMALLFKRARVKRIERDSV